MRRSSSVRPRGSFHSAMSRLMLISCGIQWLAQPARYFSQAHLYLNGTSWLTSALQLMTRLSSTVTRPKAVAVSAGSSSSACSAALITSGCTASAPEATGASPSADAPGIGSSSKLSILSPPLLSGCLLAGLAFRVVDRAELRLGSRVDRVRRRHHDATVDRHRVQRTRFARRFLGVGRAQG